MLVNYGPPGLWGGMLVVAEEFRLLDVEHAYEQCGIIFKATLVIS